MTRTHAMVLLLSLSGAATDVLRAQDFSAIQLNSLPIVFVEDRAGTETRGRLLSITATAIAIDAGGTQRTFAPSEVVKVERRGDSLKNGALIGAAVGLLTGFIGDCPRMGSNNSDGCPGARVAYVLGGSAIWAAIGAGIDALIPGRTLVWRAPTP